MATEQKTKSWPRWLPWLIVGVFALELALALRPVRSKGEVDIAGFGRLPVLLNGRVQPLDSVARNALLQIRGNTDVPLEGTAADGQWGDLAKFRATKAGSFSERKWYQFGLRPKKLKPTEWLMEVLMRPELSDERFVFLIHHPELLAQLNFEKLGLEKSGLRYFTFRDLQPQLKLIEDAGRTVAAIKPEVRTPYQKAVMQLGNALQIYLRLKISLQPNSLRPDGKDFGAELADLRAAIPAGLESIRKQQAGEPYDKEAFARLLALAEPYSVMADRGYLLMIPPTDLEKARDGWGKMGVSLLDSIRSGKLHPAASAYAAMSSAYTKADGAAFTAALKDQQSWFAEHLNQEVSKATKEHYFNHYQPFLRSQIIYLLALVLACLSWLNLSQWMNRSAFYLVLLALAAHTSGIIFRMYIEGRPPVTNLYSSAIFVGWGSVVLGAVLERIYRNGIGSVTASAIGFITLIIASHLALAGDTMEMMRAVLDTNFWLATHVVVITLGYAATFLAGFLALVYVLRGVLTRSLDAATASSLARMVYGIVCFATLFSFVGTILGGIWADQSWGRFWGWDPKENGALLIVIWNATILHARWGGMIKDRGLMNMALIGNIVTAFSWFGVNMLGIGLHSYGFMDAAFKWIAIFTGSQLLLIAIGLMPIRLWGSSATLDKASPTIGKPVA